MDGSEHGGRDASFRGGWQVRNPQRRNETREGDALLSQLDESRVCLAGVMVPSESSRGWREVARVGHASRSTVSSCSSRP